MWKKNHALTNFKAYNKPTNDFDAKHCDYFGSLNYHYFSGGGIKRIKLPHTSLHVLERIFQIFISSYLNIFLSSHFCVKKKTPLIIISWSLQMYKQISYGNKF